MEVANLILRSNPYILSKIKVIDGHFETIKRRGCSVANFHTHTHTKKKQPNVGNPRQEIDDVADSVPVAPVALLRRLVPQSGRARLAHRSKNRNFFSKNRDHFLVH